MTTRWSRFGRITLVTAALAGLLYAPAATAGEEDDLQRQIETQRAGLSDLDRLDDTRTTTEEITMLRSWLDEAWNLRSKHEYDQVREVLDRCLSQAELIRQKISAAKLRVQVQNREATVSQLRAKIKATRKALQDTQVKKRALEEPTT
jgi:predicted RND superfamily exporter protein